MSELNGLREAIDALDARITELFLQRMELTRRVGEYKRAHGIPVLDPQREREVLAQKTALVADPALRDDVAALYEAIMGISRRQQRRLVNEAGNQDYARIRGAMDGARAPLEHPRVLYQGEPGAYADEAAARFFGEDLPRSHVGTWEEVFQSLQRGEADYGVVPIENSSTGSINQVYDLLAQYGHSIVGEQTVKVDHCLAAPAGARLDGVTTVYSHEQGLLQCAGFLKGRGWTCVPRLNTAESAQFVARSGSPGQAAICSPRAARLYSLEILAEHISDSDSNDTRFVVVSPVMERRSGSDKVSILFRLPHRAGSLQELLTIFAVNGLNLLKLESRPIPCRSWEYRFFADFSGDLTAPGMDGVLLELTRTAERLRVLGSYRSSGEG